MSRDIKLDPDDRTWFARLKDRAGEFRSNRPGLAAAAVLVPASFAVITVGAVAAAQEPEDPAPYALAFAVGGGLLLCAALCLWRCKP
jgi:hypothetical protein